MEECIVEFDGDEMTLWDFSKVHLQFQQRSFTLKFAENERKRKLTKLFESIQSIEGDLIRVISEAPTYKEGIRRFFDDKLFGSFEQMRVEMELRYKAEKVILTTGDKTKLHGYWVPCSQQDKRNSESSDDEDEDDNFKGGNNPTMIFCNPNAGFAEYF